MDDKLSQITQVSDPWTLPVEAVTEVLSPISLVQKELKILRLLPPAKEINVPDVELKLEDLLLEVDLDKLKLRPARKIAMILGINQKNNGKHQKLSFLVSQIKSKLQQAKAEIIEVVRQELIAY